MSIPTSLEGLQPLPLRAIDDKSVFPKGRFFVSTTISGDDGKPLVVGQASATVRKTWFKSPPLSQAAIEALQSVQLFADTHDQGWVDDRALGNWTWLEIALYENESSDSPRTREGVELAWQSHKNDMGSKEYGWLAGEVLPGKHDMMGLLEVGNCIGVRVCALYSGWALYGRAACLVLEMGKPTIIDQPPSFAEVFQKTVAVQQLLDCVNANNSTYSPKIKAAWNLAETFAGNEKRPLRVLALDGGGVRGYSSLMLLKEVMDRAAPNKRPHEVFDLIGGTSTGGLIAIMLGRLKMSAQECLDTYDSVMKDVFGSGWLHKHIGRTLDYLTKGEFYSARQLEKAIKELLRKKLGQKADNVLLLDESNPCKIFLMATREESANNRGPVFLRSYTNDLDPPGSDLANIKLWEAARATSAAPGYFRPIQVGRVKLVDGGLLANNPLGWLWTEILSFYGPTRETDCFLSIGTGMGANLAVAQPGLDFQKAMESFAVIATNTENTNILFRVLVDAFAPHAQTKKYYRLNVSKELPEPADSKGILGWLTQNKPLKGVLNNFDDPGSLDDVDAIPRLKEWTTEWIKSQRDIIVSCSEALARHL